MPPMCVQGNSIVMSSVRGYAAKASGWLLRPALGVMQRRAALPHTLRIQL